MKYVIIKVCAKGTYMLGYAKHVFFVYKGFFSYKMKRLCKEFTLRNQNRAK